jgi:hypothetical protein
MNGRTGEPLSKSSPKSIHYRTLDRTPDSSLKPIFIQDGTGWSVKYYQPCNYVEAEYVYIIIVTSDR